MSKLLEPSNVTGTLIDRRSNLSYEEFVEEYAKPRKPVILMNEMDNWPAKAVWTFDFLKSQYGSISVLVRHSKRRDEYFTVELGEYVEYLMDPEKEDDPLYLADWDFSADLPELLTHYSVPAVFKNWLQHVPRTIMPPLRWFYIGPSTSGTGLHIDIANTSAWNAVFSGRKRWVFFSPDQTPYMYDGKVNAFDVDLEKYPLFKKATPLIGIQNPGEIMYTPGGWWHQVRNEEDCISITENFINEVNFKEALLPYAKAILRYNKNRFQSWFRRNPN